MIVWASIALIPAVMMLGPSVVAGGLQTYAASGRGLQVVGPDPFNLGNTRPVEGSIHVRVRDPARPGGVSLVAEFGRPGARYRVEARTLSARHAHREQAVAPALTPRLVAWGSADVTLNGRLVAARVPVAATVLADPPITGISLEVSTARPSLRGVPDGYLHVMWHDPATLSLDDRAPGSAHRVR